MFLMLKFSMASVDSTSNVLQYVYVLTTKMFRFKLYDGGRQTGNTRISARIDMIARRLRRLDIRASKRSCYEIRTPKAEVENPTSKLICCIKTGIHLINPHRSNGGILPEHFFVHNFLLHHTEP